VLLCNWDCANQKEGDSQRSFEGRREIVVSTLGVKSDKVDDTVPNRTNKNNIGNKIGPVTVVNTVYQAKRNRHRRKINITTLMMFLITSIYVTTRFLYWSGQIMFFWTRKQNPNYDLLVKRLYTVNCMTNTILFTSMSTKLRVRAWLMFCSNLNIHVNCLLSSFLYWKYNNTV
jgi:hypothetical protein